MSPLEQIVRAREVFPYVLAFMGVGFTFAGIGGWCHYRGHRVFGAICLALGLACLALTWPVGAGDGR